MGVEIFVINNTLGFLVKTRRRVTQPWGVPVFYILRKFSR